MKVDVEYERGENDETVEKRDPRSCVRNRTEGVDCEEDIESEDAQKRKIDAMRHENNQSLQSSREESSGRAHPKIPLSSISRL